tara:strand:- start:150 stop:443 length:294 start_codon:yes stop_codon:yes gene_type:complete
MDTPSRLKQKCEEVRDLLLSKNKNYGDSALKPAEIFSKQTPIEGICSRIDSCLSRVKNNAAGVHDPAMRETIKDLAGYFVLLDIALDEEDEKFENKN